MSSVVLSGDTSGTVTLTVPAIAGNNTVTIPAGTGTAAVQGVSTNIVSGTVVASTSGTSIDFTGIPSWVKRITVMFNSVSTTGTSNLIVQVGTTTPTTSGYAGSYSYTGTTAASNFNSSFSGFQIANLVTAASLFQGAITLTLIDSSTNKWTCTSTVARSDANQIYFFAGSITNTTTLNLVRITTGGGTDTFDAGSINILYE